MKLKYYLRGLGIGIIVTTIIMSFIKQPESLTDTQIKARARELGMVEKSVLADLRKEETTYEEITAEDQEDIRETAGEADVMEVEENSVDVNEGADVNEGVGANEDADVEEETNIEEEVDVNNNIDISEETDANKNSNEDVENYIVISIVGGSASEIVSRKLFEAGLVESEVEYNRFLIDNGYDKKLRPGNHEIPVGATEEEMAQILCGMK